MDLRDRTVNALMQFDDFLVDFMQSIDSIADVRAVAKTLLSIFEIKVLTERDLRVQDIQLEECLRRLERNR